MSSAIDLRLGDWREVLADVESVDAVICDPPYSPRVHSGQRTGARPRGGGGRKTTITYDAISSEWCDAFAAAWAPRVKHWIVLFSDHLGARWWESALEGAGLYVFAPVIWLRTAPTPRLAGDGPTSACDYLVVARPRRAVRGERAGSRPGFYSHKGNNAHENPHPGSKMLAPMRALVRDYSLPGDLVCDPCAGSGTTMIAAAEQGRRAIGAEIDPDTYAKAKARIDRGFTPDLFSGAVASKQSQGQML